MGSPPRKTCLGPRRITRREMIQLGGSLMLGLSLPELLRVEVRSPATEPESRRWPRRPTPAS